MWLRAACIFRAPWRFGLSRCSHETSLEQCQLFEPLCSSLVVTFPGLHTTTAQRDEQILFSHAPGQQAHHRLVECMSAVARGDKQHGQTPGPRRRLRSLKALQGLQGPLSASTLESSSLCSGKGLELLAVCLEICSKPKAKPTLLDTRTERLEDKIRVRLGS